MNKAKLSKLVAELASLRSHKRNLTERDLVGFANRCGRVLRAGGKGKHPAYVSAYLHHSFPLSIPSHPGIIPVGTASNILDTLEKDINEMDELLEKSPGGVL